MFRRLANSWELVKASAAVLRADKELLIFPIVSAIGSIIVLATFALPMLLAGLLESMLGGEGGPAAVIGYVVAFGFYLVQYFVIIFSNTALVGAAMIRLEGGDPTVGDGFRIAFRHIGSIFGYALLSATVGLILRWVSRRGGLGRLVSSFLGLAWGVATYLVVPVLVVEEIGPVDAIKRSAGLLRQTWGEQIVGNFSINTVFGLLTFLVVLAGIALSSIVFAATGTLLSVVPIALPVVAVVILLGLVSSALGGIYSAAVYRYAIDGDSGTFFKRELVEGAFRRK